MSGFGRKGLAQMPAQQPARAAGASNASIRFDVTPHPWKMLFIACACVCGILIFVALALEGRGLILYIIPLSPTGAQIFYVVMALVCVVGFVHTLRSFFGSFAGKVWITLDHNSITGPTKYSGIKTVRIGFNTIQKVDLSSLSGNQFLVIKGRRGEKIKVGSPNFRDQSEWPKFLDELDRKLGG